VGGGLSQSVARSLSVALLVALVACSGGSDRSGRRPKTTSPSTTAPPATIDLSKPIPGGSLHGTPRPPLENTGDDYVPILRSIAANFRWLTENPDVALLADLYTPSTETYQYQATFFTQLVNNGWRGADDGYRLLSVDVVDAQQDLVSLRVQDEFTSEQIVDSSGAQLETRPRNPTVKTWSVLMSRDASGHWRVASWTETSDSVEL
jgi:hypothetical protein